METKPLKSAEIETMLNGETSMPIYVVNFYENEIIVNAKTYFSYLLAENAVKNWYEGKAI
jgi:hypothetical protein